MRCIPRSWVWALLGVLCLTVQLAAGQPGIPDLKLRAQLIWGTDEPGSPTFGPNDVLDVGGLVAQLTKRPDGVSQYLWSKFSDTTRRKLEAYRGTADAKSVQQTLCEELTKIVEGPSIFEQHRFESVKLTPETRDLLARNPQGPELQHLNRLLLVDAYPTAVAKIQPRTRNNARLKEVDPKLREKLKMFRRKSYFEVDREQFAVKPRGSAITSMSHRCVIEVTHLDRDTIEVSLYGEGTLVTKVKQSLPKGEYLILAGPVKENRADTWFVALSVRDP